MSGSSMVALGNIPYGRRWRLNESYESAVPEEQGKHYILHFEDDLPQKEVSLEERKRLLGVAYEIAFSLSARIAPGRFRITVNGPAAGSQPHFHIHIICPSADLKIRRAVDSIAAP